MKLLDNVSIQEQYRDIFYIHAWNRDSIVEEFEEWLVESILDLGELVAWQDGGLDLGCYGEAYFEEWLKEKIEENKNDNM